MELIIIICIVGLCLAYVLRQFLRTKAGCGCGCAPSGCCGSGPSGCGCSTPPPGKPLEPIRPPVR